MGPALLGSLGAGCRLRAASTLNVWQGKDVGHAKTFNVPRYQVRGNFTYLDTGVDHD